MKPEDRFAKQNEKLFSGVVWLNSKVMGLVLGLLLGGAIFILTNWLVLKGGPVAESGETIVGPHLSLLGHIFIGYNVSFLGSLVGFAYGFTIGTLAGSLMGHIYNLFVRSRN